MFRSYKFRLYPTRAQEQRLVEILDRCRELYNAALEQRRDAWRRCGKTLTRFDQGREIRTLDGYKGLNRISEFVLARLDRAFQAFFRRVKAGEVPGYPRFRNRYRFRSFETDTVRATPEALRFAGLRIAWRPWRELPADEEDIRMANIVREADGWHAVVVCRVAPEALQPTGAVVGVDLGLLSLVATSDGETTAAPKFLARAAKRLRRAQRRVSRRKKGSRRRRKAVVLLARQYQRVARTRAHFLHGLSKRLVTEHDVIVVENLGPMGRMGPRSAQGRGMRRAIHDASWGILVSQITYKAESAGRTVVRVDPRGTSQECSGCGHEQRKTLKERVHRCASCGLMLDRDVNAARNILNRGLQLLRGGDGLSGAPTNREHRGLST